MIHFLLIFGINSKLTLKDWLKWDVMWKSIC